MTNDQKKDKRSRRMKAYGEELSAAYAAQEKTFKRLKAARAAYHREFDALTKEMKIKDEPMLWPSFSNFGVAD
jgi:hypothetical protein